MQKTLELQYDLIKSARSVLLDYCETMSREDFLTENSAFGRGSVRNLLVHNANTYIGWLGIRALKRDRPFMAYESVSNVPEIRRLFKDIDTLAADFIAGFSGDYLTPIELDLGDEIIAASPFMLFTHVITHEFHHKGQILSLSRHLGYTPVDTDVMR
ncbi:MAG: DinB family protein [Saprospiraceae bacterium]|nr:DinB family protein [Saprospiraceae bacterium]MDZ4704676.1 DinB family protein [Saprospiraceae bacterium]